MLYLLQRSLVVFTIFLFNRNPRVPSPGYFFSFLFIRGLQDKKSVLKLVYYLDMQEGPTRETT